MVSTETQANQQDDSLRAIVAELERRVRTLEKENKDLQEKVAQNRTHSESRISTVIGRVAHLEQKGTATLNPEADLGLTPIERHLAEKEELRNKSTSTHRAIFIARWLKKRGYATEGTLGYTVKSDDLKMRAQIESEDQREGRLSEDKSLAHIQVKRALEELSELLGDKATVNERKHNGTKKLRLVIDKEHYDDLVLSPEDFEELVLSQD